MPTAVTTRTLTLGLLLAFAACNRTPEPTGTRAEPATPAAAATSETQPESKASALASAAGGSFAAEAAPASSGLATATPSAGVTAGAAPVASASPRPAVAIPPGHRKVLAKPVATVQPSPDDPLAGKFTLDMAVAGLTGKGPLVAEIKTELGKLDCELYDDRAPITVANFVGLARGLRPFKNPQKEWVKAPAYDGTTFHRVVKGFMIQGGDPSGTGAGDPGYVIPDEIWEDAYHSERGLLAMANRGPNTNSMQFFIMDGSAPHLDNGYTIFGKCGPSTVIDKLASVEVKGDRSLKPTKIEKITIRRKAR
jgi:peptidyl-prolyl cis-trans isomerase A (cyclophilin A)